MPNERLTKSEHAAALQGDPLPLLKQLGSNAELGALATRIGASRSPAIKSRRALRQFLKNYRTQTLIPRELPLIYQACQFASRGAARELISLDQAVDGNGGPPELAAASQQVGRRYLQSLRPLRDHRLVRRYLQAIDEGKAQGWHPVVYGLMLAVYSIPHRQGLLHYARQTLGGFIDAAAHDLRLSQTECRQLLEELCVELPRALESTLTNNGASEPFPGASEPKPKPGQ